MAETADLRDLLARREYAALKRRANALAPAELLEGWAALRPLEKLVVFKLLEPAQAMAFFGALGFDDRYLVFCGFEHGSIAPVTEELGPRAESLFVRLGQDEYREMLRRLSA